MAVTTVTQATLGVCSQDNLESRSYEDQCYRGGEEGKNQNYHFYVSNSKSRFSGNANHLIVDSYPIVLKGILHRKQSFDRGGESLSTSSFSHPSGNIRQ